MNTIQAFEAWLRQEGYLPSTVVNYGKSLVAMHTHGGELPLLPIYIAAARAFLRWPEHTHTPSLTDAARRLDERQRAASSAPVSRTLARRNAQTRRRHEARAFGDAMFAQLAGIAWSYDDAESATISVMCATGLRIGDVLAVERRSLQEARAHGILRLVVKGGDERLLPWLGAEEEWAKLLALFTGLPANIVTVADLVVGKPDASTLPASAAYKRVDRRLKALALEAGIDERVHLHRLRRTVAVRALGETRDIAAVQQLLGHRNIATTARYVDEARPEVLAGIQRNINPRRKTK